MSKASARPPLSLGEAQFYRQPFRPESLHELSREIGPALYALYMDDGLMKIGYSQDVILRVRKLGGEVLAIRSGTYEEEQEIHRGLKAYRAKRREYYYPVPAVIAVVNEMRAIVHLDPIIDRH